MLTLLSRSVPCFPLPLRFLFMDRILTIVKRIKFFLVCLRLVYYIRHPSGYQGLGDILLILSYRIFMYFPVLLFNQLTFFLYVM